MSLGYETDPTVCANVYHSWKSTRNALSQSIQSYINACDALTSISINTLTQSVTAWGGSGPNTLSTIEAELSGLVHEEERLMEARVSLLESRNASKTLSTISTLPTEILSSIFLIANTSSTAGTTSAATCYLTAIASVCRLWRRITLGLPSMWSHLYYVIDGPEIRNAAKCAELWSDRAGDAPLDVKIYQREPRFNVEDAIVNVYGHLSCQATRVECLYLQCSRQFMQSTLCCLINEGTPGSTRVLQLHEVNEFDEPNHILSWWHNDIADEAPSPDLITEFLSSVQFLELENTYFPWDSAAYHDLFELSLDLVESYVSDSGLLPTQQEMKYILSSSPMLHTLSLELASSLQELQASVEPIRLDNLQQLTLKSHELSGCLGLLPLIQPGQTGLNVNVTVHPGFALVKEMRLFFQRSTITTLHVRLFKTNLWFKLLSRDLSHLESLTLEKCNFTDRDLLDGFNSPSASSSHISPWPKLHTLKLVNCQINGDILRHIIPINSIRTIRLYGGSNIGPQSRVYGVVYSDDILMQQLEQQMSAIVPDTKRFPSRAFFWP